MPVRGTEAFRIFTLSTGAALISVTAIVFYVYFLAWRRSPLRKGLIPRYVIGVATFVVITEAIFVLLVIDLVHRDARVSIFAPLIVTANLILCMSLRAIFRYERRVISAATTSPGPVPQTTPLRRAEDFVPLDRRWWGRNPAAEDQPVT